MSTGQINSAEIYTLPDFVNDVSEKEREKKERKKKTLERGEKNFEQNRAETIVIYHVHNERARLYVRKAQPLHVNES